MNLPNLLTILRIILSGFFIFFMYQVGVGSKILALILFSAAAITDYFDGHIARKYNLISNFGKLMDPIADKFLMLSAFFIFAEQGFIKWWIFTVIAVREIWVTVYRLNAAKKGIVLAADTMGKLKTVLQISIAVFILLFNVVLSCNFAVHINGQVVNAVMLFIEMFMWVVVAVTIYSGIECCKNKCE
ncbi:MAG: CDP-diacylglycerol--glycerol-3-phosphate 3-phosphatidyltransferase [Candidatus Omnitrophica bacterium]|nr:CDP-diacylglycerol--glycerol-3-phosphate 3-phosphatidyltransferase [Candidatus Omnitrophota bacterium]